MRRAQPLPEDRKKGNRGDERHKSEGDIRVEAESHGEAAEQRTAGAAGSEGTQQPEYGERRKSRHHDGAKADAREVYVPEIRGEEERGKECYSLPRVSWPIRPSQEDKFPCGEINSENCQYSHGCRDRAQRPGVVAEESHGERLDIDEESLTAVIVGVEQLVFAARECFKRVDAVYGLVRKQAIRDLRKEKETEKYSKNENRGKQNPISPDIHPSDHAPIIAFGKQVVVRAGAGVLHNLVEAESAQFAILTGNGKERTRRR